MQPVRSRLDTLVRFGGAVCLGFAAVVSLLLSLRHFGGLHLPGCGAGGACDLLSRSAWGRVPALDWPVSHVGVAYFSAMAAAWLATPGRPAAWLRSVAWLGGLASIAFVGLMIAETKLCAYCIAAHVANLAFVALAEWSALRSPRPASTSARSAATPLGVALAAFLVATAALAVAESARRGEARREAQRAAEESTQRIIAATTQRASAASQPAAMSIAVERVRPPASAPVPSAASSPLPPVEPPSAGFTGRWRLGPERAPIRIVVCSDYQCPACKQVESELRQIHRARSDVSISMKHFPVCTDCNRYMPRTMHRNACWAARAAETAGMLRGNEAFWAMHFALFDRGGSFTNQELRQLVAEHGFDADEFERVMKSDEPLRRIQQDIDHAMAVGMTSTPLVMINGVELRGWQTPGTIARAVEQLAATNPPALGPEVDRPPPATEKLVNEWRATPAQALPVGDDAWWNGPTGAPIEIVMFADYQEPTVARADAAIRAEMARAGDVRYAVVRYPCDQECNPTVQTTVHAQACWAAKVAIAAGRLGGADGYWKMHDWLLANQHNLSDAALAARLGLDADALFAAARQPPVLDRIIQECNAAQRLGLTSIPTIYVNRKRVAMWDYYGHPILPHVIDAARAAK